MTGKIKSVYFVAMISVIFFVILLIIKQFLLSIAFSFVLATIIILFVQLEKLRQKINEANLKTEYMLKLKPIKDEATSNETKKLINEFSVELKLEEYKIEQEKRYRELSKNILDLDTKVNEKFDLLGRAILKLNKSDRD